MPAIPGPRRRRAGRAAPHSPAWTHLRAPHRVRRRRRLGRPPWALARRRDVRARERAGAPGRPSRLTRRLHPFPLPMSDIQAHPAAGLAAHDPKELRVTRLRALRGPNYWRLAPVIACDVALGALEDVPTRGSPASTTGCWSPPDAARAPVQPRHGGRLRRAAGGGDAAAARAGARLARAADARRQRRELRPRRAVGRRRGVVGDRRLRGGGRRRREHARGGAARPRVHRRRGVRRRRAGPRPAANCTRPCGSARPPAPSSRRRGGAASPCAGSTTARSCSSGSGATCAASRRR